jgi:predicted short-subunit dehydrogenase-like oxidoreductase (DUF2520 family)
VKIIVLGRGRVGTGLSRALRAAGVRVRLAPARTAARELRDADAVVLAVPDNAIAAIAHEIAPALRRGAVVFHCAGARDVSELAPCAERGAETGVLHPLVSFANAKAPPSMRGATFVVHGSPRAIAAGKRLARACRGRAVVAPAHGPAYHAAAALVANGSAALAHAAVRVLERLGLGRDDAEHAVGGLLRSVADNVETIGVPAALTGPIARGDAGAVAAHRVALGRTDRAALAAYDGVAPAVLACARDAGLSEASSRSVARALRRKSPVRRRGEPGRR